MLVTKTNPKGVVNSMEIDITQEQLDAVNNRRSTGQLIQHIVPDLSRSQREFLMTGWTDEDWDEMFPPETK